MNVVYKNTIKMSIEFTRVNSTGKTHIPLVSTTHENRLKWS